MHFKKKIKIIADFLMTAALLLLMSYQVTGEKYHEWLGVSMFLLFIIHNTLNIHWYKNIEAEDKSNESGTLVSGMNEDTETTDTIAPSPENFVLITGGTFEMGSRGDYITCTEM